MRYKVEHVLAGPFVFTREDGQTESFDDPEIAGLHCKKLRELGHEVSSDTIRTSVELFEELVRLLSDLSETDGGREIAEDGMRKLGIKKERLN